MRERPILMSGQMVRAILDGRKTQTRRPIADVSADCELFLDAGDGFWQQCYRDGGGAIHSKSWLSRCPYGQPGDRLYVRETWQDTRSPGEPQNARQIMYRADDDRSLIGWRPSIHMPRWASRITLEITGVRVERVQDISEDDAMAEGMISTAKLNEANDDYAGMYARDIFSQEWDSIYAKRGMGWDDNPWVWVIEFRRINNE